MSSELFRALEFVQVGAVACFSSLGAAILTEFLFPAYDSRRNPVWQGMEGILGMVFHYLVGLEVFTLLCPLRYIAYPATVFAVFSPVMIPNTLSKMNNAMSGLAGLVRPAATWSPPSPVGPPRPVPGTRVWDSAIQRMKAGAARAITDLNIRISQEVTDEVAAQVDALELQMRKELGEVYADYLSSRDAKVKQLHDDLQVRWATALASLRQSVAQARVNAKAKLSAASSTVDCVGAGMRKATNAGFQADGVAPFCVACPPGYSWQPKTGAEDEQFQLSTVHGGLVCKPDGGSSADPDPVVPYTPPAGLTLYPGTYAFIDDPQKCEKTVAGLSEQQIPDFFNACGEQTYPLPATGVDRPMQREFFDGCSIAPRPNCMRGVAHEEDFPKTSECYECVPPPPGEYWVGLTLETPDGKKHDCVDMKLRS